jgi:hypothetical protein
LIFLSKLNPERLRHASPILLIVDHFLITWQIEFLNRIMLADPICRGADNANIDIRYRKTLRQPDDNAPPGFLRHEERVVTL